MKSKWGYMDLLLLLIGLVPVGFWVAFYDRLPGQVAVHFGLNDAANGWMSRQTAAAFLGLLGIGVPVLMKVTRFVDPKRENYEKFLGTFEALRMGVALMLAVVSGFVLMFNLGYEVPAGRVAMLIVGALIALMGNYLGRIRYNFTMGIRTPWTLASEDVWRRTHRFAAPLWLAGGLLLILVSFLPGAVSPWGLAVLAAVVLAPIVYSFVAYQKANR